MIGQSTGMALKKNFQLRWAKRDEARIHSGGEWQLRFKDNAAHDLANRRLSVDRWLSHRNSSDDEIIYTFINDIATLSEALADVTAAKIPEEEIEIEAPELRVSAAR